MTTSDILNHFQGAIAVGALLVSGYSMIRSADLAELHTQDQITAVRLADYIRTEAEQFGQLSGRLAAADRRIERLEEHVRQLEMKPHNER